jgi:hypothetical protein
MGYSLPSLTMIMPGRRFDMSDARAGSPPLKKATKPTNNVKDNPNGALLRRRLYTTMGAVRESTPPSRSHP